MEFDFNSMDHTFFMGEALKEAALAGEAGERPIGAVIVHRGQIVGEAGRNTAGGRTASPMPS